MDKQLSGRLWGYLISLGMVAGITLISSALRSFSVFDPADVEILYLLAVAISAAYFGFGPALMAAFLGALTFDFFFIPPILTFTVTYEKDSVNLLIMFLAAVAISCLSPALRR